MDKKTILFKELAQYYDLIYSFKNYEDEAKLLLSLIKEYKQSPGNSLLDVACGTGKHLNYLKDSFQCAGTDINNEILAVARTNISNVDFIEADMINMRLNKKFDVLLCLFTAIGYLETYENLAKTWETFALHLKPGGVAIVEPWFTKETCDIGTPHMKIYDSEDLKIIRMSVPKIDGDFSILDFHYLVAEKDKEVKYYKDSHKLALFEPDKLITIMQKAGLKAHFIHPELMGKRGLYIGVKPIISQIQ